MSNRSDNDLAFLLIILIGGGIAFAVWKFSTACGLDIATGASVMMRLAIPIALGAAALKFCDYYDMFSFGNVWPVLLGLVWFAWWPALDYWAAHAEGSFSLYDESVTVWWNAWYTEFGVLAALVGGGYFVKKLASD
ncbi:TPA: hypothetical protein QDB48_004108 [Burkholderia vietnamiensis]|nr:hypothetical protein [Burkholderia vietnamiensis]